MKCKFCGGSGNDIWSIDGVVQPCPVCGGTGVIKPLTNNGKPITNEEWFNTLTTEEKAETIAQLSSYGGNVEAILEWLKEKHNG